MKGERETQGKKAISGWPQEIGGLLAIAYKSPIARFLLGRMFQRNLRRSLSGHYLKARVRKFSKLKFIGTQGNEN